MTTESPNSNNDDRRAIHILAWAAQLALAVIFSFAGGFKAFTAPAALLAKAPDLASLPLPLVRFIGIAELAAAAGLILPALTRIAPKLTPLAALCVMPILAGAFVINVREGHLASQFFVIVCTALAAFVAWARLTQTPISPRNALSSAAPAGV